MAGWKRLAAKPLLARLREWDRATAEQVTHFIAISRTVQQRIRECYERDSVVIHPPVATDFYTPADARHTVPAARGAHVPSTGAPTNPRSARRRPRHAGMEEEALAPAAAAGGTDRRESAAFDARTVNGTDQDVCRRETAELNRIRATRDLRDAKRFVSAVTCDALKLQAARPLKRLTE